MTNETEVLEAGPKKMNRRDVLIAGAGATLTAATLAGTSALAAAQTTGSEVRYQSFPGVKIPLPETYMSDHDSDGVHPPKKGMPPPLTANVNKDNPLEYYLYWSMRSPYSYLVLDRILALNKHYNVKMNFMPTLPIAVKSAASEGGHVNNGHIPCQP